MRISWNWLSRHLDTDGLDPHDVGRLFTLKVAELDGIIELGKGIERVTLVRVLEVGKHPSSDKLSLVRMTDGNAVHQLVCGAPNAKDAVGRLAAWVPPGTTLPDGTRIEVAAVRGVESAGMLASEAELGLSEEHDGILILDEGTPGQALVDALPVRDVVFEVDNKAITHRPDLWGHRGIAREVASLTGRPLRPEPAPLPIPTTGAPVAVHVDAPDLCPRYLALRFDGVRVGPSPAWLAWALRSVGQRPRSNVVDLTNFVMLDLGNPIHAFDATKLDAGGIVVRRATPQESFRTLDGQQRVLPEGALVIATADEAGVARAVAVAGVMGGENSEIDDGTTSVVLEAANFSADSVRKTSSRLGLRTDASARFEKALDPHLAESAAHLFGRLLVETIPGVRISSPLTDVCAPLPAPLTLTLRLSAVSERLGLLMPKARVETFLRGLGFGVRDGVAETLTVDVPSWRATRDVRIEEDLIEEVGRLHGYSEIPPVAAQVLMSAPRLPVEKLQERRVRRTLSLGAGMAETVSYAFDNKPLLERLGADLTGRVELQNSLSSEQDRLRRWLAPNLLTHAERNARMADRIRMYEVGRVFDPRGEALPHQPRMVGFVVSEKTDGPESAWRTLRGLTDAVIAASHARTDRIAFKRPEQANVGLRATWLHPARSLEVFIGEAHAGYLTLLHPAAARVLDLRRPTALAELDLDLLLAEGDGATSYTPLPRFPAVPFDVAFEVPVALPTAAVAEAIRRGAAGAPLRELSWMSSFPLPSGTRSDAYHLVFRLDDRSLTSDEVAGFTKGIVTAVAELGGVLRG